MSDPINEVLVAILEMLKDQAIYLQRQRGWLTAIADAVETNTDLDAFLKAHPFYKQPPRPDEQIMHDAIQRIDALLQLLNRQA